MAEKQQTLIYIEKENHEEARFMSRNFVNKEVKNRAYLNALGAELLTGYLASDGIDVSGLHNIHSISRILENNDISDILLPNIHIDVRVVFDENKIFVPKSHFEKEIAPDVYAVLKIDESYKTAEFLGYFQPSQIDKKNANSDYYFVSNGTLVSADNFTTFVKGFIGKSPRYITEEDMLRGRELSVSLADHNISAYQEKELLELLLLSDALRESVLEFDNFETLAYSAAPEVARLTDEMSLATPVDDSITETEVDEEIETYEDDMADELTEDSIVEDELTEEDLQDEILEENLQEEVIKESVPEETEQEVSEDEPVANAFDIGEDLLGDNMLEEVKLDEEVSMAIDVPTEDITEMSIDETEPIQPEVSEDTVQNSLEETVESEVQDIETPLSSATLSVDDILDKTISAIDDKKPELSKEDKKANVANNIVAALAGTTSAAAQTIEDNAVMDSSAIAAAATAAAVAAAVTTAANAVTTPKTTSATEVKIDETDAVTDDAMKLAAVSGESVQDVIINNLAQQNRNIDRIDYATTDITPEAKEITDSIDTVSNMFESKMEDNLENELSGKYDQPKDLSEMNKVETIASEEKEQVFEHETINIHEMETVENDLYREEDIDSLSDIESLTSMDNLVNPEMDFAELHGISESEVVDLPSATDFTINEDGTSSLDMFGMDEAFGQENTENLIDMAPLSGSISESLDLNENISLDDEISMPQDVEAPAELVFNQNYAQEMPSVQDNELEVSSEDLLDNIEENVTEDFAISEAISEDDVSEEETLEAEINDSVGDSDFSEELLNETEETSLDISMEEAFSEELASEPVEDINFTETEQPIDEVIDEPITGENIEDSIEEPSETIFEETPQEMVETPSEEVSEPIDEVSADSSDELSLEEFEQLFGAAEESAPSEAPQGDIFDDASMQTADEWLDDTNYDSMQDVEPMSSEENIEISEEVAAEPVGRPAPTMFAVKSNSRVISDKDITVGEIPIDINVSENVQFNGAAAPLGDLYNKSSRMPGDALLNNPGRMSAGNTPKKSPVGGILGTFVVLAIVGTIGFFAAKMFKAPTQEAPQPITDGPLPSSSDNGVTEAANTLDIDQSNVVNMDNNSNALASTASTSSVDAARQTGSATTFVDVKKLTWEVPDYISYNANFKQYFQSVGKSLKLALTSDLLLATDYIYSSPVKISVTFTQDGTFKSSQIINSSGSTQIDSIVLQTVNQTLKGLKAPNSVNNDESTTAILKIYF